MLIIVVFCVGDSHEVRAEESVTYSGLGGLPITPGENIGVERGYETADGMRGQVTDFQNWYNTNCSGDLDPDGLYGTLTHAAKEKVASGGCGGGASSSPLTPSSKVSSSSLNKCLSDDSGGFPPVMHGCILPGPKSGTEGVSYVSNRFLPSIASTILVYILSIAVAVIIIGGIIYIVSSVNTELTGKARDAIAWAIAGSCIAILAYTIVRFIIGINFMG